MKFYIEQANSNNEVFETKSKEEFFDYINELIEEADDNLEEEFTIVVQ